MSMPRLACAALAGFTVAALACSSSPRPSIAPGNGSAGTTAEITEVDLRQRLFLIADDSTLGRETGSEGDYKTTEYIAAEFKRFGLEPAGDNGTYFQTIPFWLAAVDPASTLQAGSTTLTVGPDFLPSTLGAPPATLNSVATIYGGPLTDTTRWISRAQAAGKVVVLDLPAGAAFRGLAAGRWTGAAEFREPRSASPDATK